MLEAGIKGRQEVMVTDENSAAAVGSGLLPVFATPAMVALMEKTAWMSVAPYLNDGEGTVGTKLEIAHNAATPVGMQVWCESELVEVDGRRLVFKVEAFDAKGSIGGGTHERFIIKNEKFLAKAQSKKETKRLRREHSRLKALRVSYAGYFWLAVVSCNRKFLEISYYTKRH